MHRPNYCDSSFLVIEDIGRSPDCDTSLGGRREPTSTMGLQENKWAVS